ncbi:hypothetical protein [Microbacterium sp. C7(2022)]|uniref:hypothetical protein n=1 Tax=Microbacterium sp. C7(2022) TaxID=2992759 RepID=UPI00237B0540|nr:hypothetical protein [Microbacterium sp. C7(2022)]MDE0545401.1 hypothetical protein [Microbacterium sp. C7(2022)]
MAADSRQRFAGSQVIAIIAVAVLAVVVVVLAVLALGHAKGEGTSGEAAPVPTFDLGVQSASPTPTETPIPEFDRANERFLAQGAGTLWRATAGECGETEPLVERSDDRGDSWVDVTPLYKGIGQVASLDPFADVQAEMVASMTDECETQALRTFTQGLYWESYPDVLAASRYIDPADPATVVLAGDEVDAPCDVAHGLRASGDTVALLCEAEAYVFDDGEWMPLPGAGAVALAVYSGTVAVAHSADDCDGVAVTQFTGADAGSAIEIGCAEGADATSPAALVATGSASYLLWSGDELFVVG